MRLTSNARTATSGYRKCRGQASPRMIITIAAAVIAVSIVALAVYLFYPEPEPEPVPAPGRPIETVEPAESGEERGDSARDIIDSLSASDDVDYAEAYARAEEFHADGRLADAQLLYFFAARGGHAPAAFALATFNDPNHYSAQASLMDEPDPFQAYRWYRTAREAGHDEADARLAELRTWAEAAAGDGDAEAERLLLQWE